MNRDDASNIGCGILAISFVIFIVVISFLTRKWDRDHAYANEIIAVGDSCLRNNNIADAIKYYSDAFDTYDDIDTLASTLMKCEYMSGNPEAALKWLDEIGKQTFHSDLIELHRNQTLFSIHKDTVRYISVLDSLIKEPVRLRICSGTSRLWDILINGDINYTQNKYYDRYYFDYYAKLMVLHNRINMARTFEELISLGEYIFSLVEDQKDDYAYMNDYLCMGAKSDYKLKEHEKYVINSDPIFSALTYLEKTNNYKWWLFNLMVTYVHQVQGYEASLEYANKITCNNSLNADSDYSYNKFLYGIYRGVKDNNNFPTSLTRSELDTILAYSSDQNGRIPFARAYVAQGERNIFSNVNIPIERFRKEGDIVYDPIVILEKDLWSWKEQSEPYLFHDDVVNMSYISDLYTASDSKICCNMFNIRVYPILSTLYVVNLLQAEYNKQKGLPVYSSVVNIKSLYKNP